MKWVSGWGSAAVAASISIACAPSLRDVRPALIALPAHDPHNLDPYGEVSSCERPACVPTDRKDLHDGGVIAGWPFNRHLATVRSSAHERATRFVWVDPIDAPSLCKRDSLESTRDRDDDTERLAGRFFCSALQESIVSGLRARGVTARLGRSLRAPIDDTNGSAQGVDHLVVQLRSFRSTHDDSHANAKPRYRADVRVSWVGAREAPTRTIDLVIDRSSAELRSVIGAVVWLGGEVANETLRHPTFQDRWPMASDVTSGTPDGARRAPSVSTPVVFVVERTSADRLWLTRLFVETATGVIIRREVDRARDDATPGDWLVARRTAEGVLMTEAEYETFAMSLASRYDIARHDDALRFHFFGVLPESSVFAPLSEPK